jgi:hypothetical protein
LDKEIVDSLIIEGINILLLYYLRENEIFLQREIDNLAAGRRPHVM